MESGNPLVVKDKVNAWLEEMHPHFSSFEKLSNCDQLNLLAEITREIEVLFENFSKVSGSAFSGLK
jgi:hypothetical protein